MIKELFRKQDIKRKKEIIFEEWFSVISFKILTSGKTFESKGFAPEKKDFIVLFQINSLIWLPFLQYFSSVFYGNRRKQVLLSYNITCFRVTIKMNPDWEKFKPITFCKTVLGGIFQYFKNKLVKIMERKFISAN